MGVFVCLFFIGGLVDIIKFICVYLVVFFNVVMVFFVVIFVLLSYGIKDKKFIYER